MKKILGKWKVDQWQVVGTAGVLLALLVAFAILNPHFFSWGNLSNMLRQIAPVLLLGVGQGVVLLTGNIDLSIGAVVGMSCMIVSSLMADHAVHPALAVLVALGACLVAGFANGVLVAKLRVPSFIATLGTMAICRGIAQLRGYSTPAVAGEAFRDFFYYGKMWGIHHTVWIALAVWVAVAIAVKTTRPGRNLCAIGRNTEAARGAGISVAVTTTGAYMLSAFLAGVVGLFTTAALGMGTMDAGNGYELFAIAVAVLSGISVFGGRGSLWCLPLGASIWAVLQNGLQFAHAKVAARNIVVGAIVLVAVAVDVLLHRTERPPRPAPQAEADADVINQSQKATGSRW